MSAAAPRGRITVEMQRMLGMVVVVLGSMALAGCRMNFDPVDQGPTGDGEQLDAVLETDAGAGSGSGASGPPSAGQPCMTDAICFLGVAGEELNAVCSPDKMCIVDCGQAATCHVDCNGAACYVACGAAGCFIDTCPSFSCFVGCESGGPTRDTATATCE